MLYLAPPRTGGRNAIWPFTLATLYVLSAYPTMYVYSINIYILYVYYVLLHKLCNIIIISSFFCAYVFVSISVQECIVEQMRKEMKSRKKW